MAKKGETGDRVRHNWPLLKIKFFKSEYQEVLPFLNKVGVTYSGHSGEMTKGWAEEKAAFIQDVYQKELNKVQAQLSIPIQELMQTKKYLIRALNQKAQVGAFVNYVDPDGKKIKRWLPDMNPLEMRNVLEVIKTELGEPTYIRQNLEKVAPATDELSDEALDELENTAKNETVAD